MEKPNPYAPPLTDVFPPVRMEAVDRRRSQFVAWTLVAAAVGVGLLYTYVDEQIVLTQFGAWPMLLATATIAVVAALITREPWIAPWCCFAGTMAGDLLAGAIRGWGYAQVHYAVPLAAAFSLPAFLAARVARRRRSR